MKQIRLFVFSLFALFAIESQAMIVNIIIDILRMDANGQFQYTNPDAQKGDLLQEMGGYYFVTRSFGTVGKALDYWKDAAERLWSAYANNDTVIAGRGRQVANLGAVCYAFSYNNYALQNAYDYEITGKFEGMKNAHKQDIDDIIDAIEELSEKRDEASESVQGITAELEGKLNSAMSIANAASTEVKAAQVQLAEIQRQLSQAATLEEVRRLQSEFNKKLAETEQKALEAGLSKKAYKEVLALVAKTEVVGEQLPPQVGSYSNQMARLNVYLGLDKDENGEPLENKGMFEEPNKKGGGKAGNINEYLNSFGVIAYKAQPEEGAEGEEEESNPFQGFTETENNNVTASFKAPVNWVDNDTIVVNAAGRYEAKPKPDLSRPWAFDTETKTFKNASVLCGSVNIVLENVSASSAGNYYCHVIAGSSGEYNASVSQSGVAPENGWCFLVATLEYSSKENKDGIVEQILVPAFTIGAVPIIVAYD